MKVWHAKHAWIGDRFGADVAITVDDGSIVEVREGTEAGEAERLGGVVLPGFVNAHSHAFHRALRGNTHARGGDFWVWRDEMYRVAALLDPDLYLRLAAAVYAEMALAGITHVGEFHYLHHDPAGRPYADPNEMTMALAAAAAEAGVRLTILDAAYLRGGVGNDELSPVQRRFSDGDVERWRKRVELLRPQLRAHPLASLGLAAHSIRALDPDEIAVVAATAGDMEVPLHFHLSEQPAENSAAMAVHGVSPTEIFSAAGALTAHATAVHATHLDDRAVDLLATSDVGVCVCPTTERDLGDGIGPIGRLTDAGCTLSVGTDGHAVIDMFEEARGVELHQRLFRGRRGLHGAAELLAAATSGGAHALGDTNSGLRPGAAADFVAVAVDSVRLAGWQPNDGAAGLVFGASAGDVTDVVVAGDRIVAERQHLRIENLAGRLGDVIGSLRGEAP